MLNLALTIGLLYFSADRSSFYHKCTTYTAKEAGGDGITHEIESSGSSTDINLYILSYAVGCWTAWYLTEWSSVLGLSQLIPMLFFGYDYYCDM